MRSRLFLPVTILLLLGFCGMFGWWQNTHGTKGGDISPAKVLWIFTTLTLFFVVPAWLWRDSFLDHGSRRLWGWFLGGWVLRAAIEVPLLLTTHLWRCEHGIAHDLVMLAGLFLAQKRLPAEDKISRRLVPLISATLIAEMTNAFLFSKFGHPEQGQYFASSDPSFLLINRITLAEVILLIPWLGCWLRGYSRYGPAS